MPLPLPERSVNNPDLAAKNAGLWWAKFFDEWPDGYAQAAGGPEKQNWINHFAGTTVGAEHDIGRAASRHQELCNKTGATSISFSTTSPFVTGIGLEHPVENGFSWHHTLGTPYIPASSIKGMIRAWACQWERADADDMNRMFGPPMDHADHGMAGNLIVFDALPLAPVPLMAEILTPHDGGWRQGRSTAPSDWHDPVPIPFLAVAPGARFLFAIAPRPGCAADDDVKTALGWLTDALDWTGAGAKTAIGFGRFQSDANRPLQAGDKIRLTEDIPKATKGDEGVIVVVYATQGLAKIKLDRGGKGSNPTVKLTQMERIS